jgi:hypothetical protein
MPTEFGTPGHWRKRAEEARDMAHKIADDTAKHEMLEIAASYERIAQRAATKLGGGASSKSKAAED